MEPVQGALYLEQCSLTTCWTKIVVKDCHFEGNWNTPAYYPWTTNQGATCIYFTGGGLEGGL